LDEKQTRGFEPIVQRGIEFRGTIEHRAAP